MSTPTLRQQLADEVIAAFRMTRNGKRADAEDFKSFMGGYLEQTMEDVQVGVIVTGYIKAISLKTPEQGSTKLYQSEVAEMV